MSEDKPPPIPTPEPPFGSIYQERPSADKDAKPLSSVAPLIEKPRRTLDTDEVERLLSTAKAEAEAELLRAANLEQRMTELETLADKLAVDAVKNAASFKELRETLDAMPDDDGGRADGS